jgi:hypothetical protein
VKARRIRLWRVFFWIAANAPTQIQKAMLDLDAMDKLVEDALLVAVHANPLKAREAVELFALVVDEVEAARMTGGEITLDRDDLGSFFVAVIAPRYPAHCRISSEMRCGTVRSPM